MIGTARMYCDSTARLARERAAAQEIAAARAVLMRLEQDVESARQAEARALSSAAHLMRKLQFISRLAARAIPLTDEEDTQLVLSTIAALAATSPEG